MDSSPRVPGLRPGSHQLELPLLRSERGFDGLVPSASQNLLGQWDSGGCEEVGFAVSSEC